MIVKDRKITLHPSWLVKICDNNLDLFTRKCKKAKKCNSAKTSLPVPNEITDTKTDFLYSSKAEQN